MNVKKSLAVSISIVVACLIMSYPIYLFFASAIQDNIRSGLLGYIRTRVSNEALEASKGKIHVDFGDIRYAYYAGSLEISGTHVTVGDGNDSAGSTIELTIPRIRVSGLLPWDILNGGGLSIGQILLDQPAANVHSWGPRAPDTVVSSDSSDVRLPSLPNVDSILHAVFVGLVPTYVQPLHIDGIRINDASFKNVVDDAIQPYVGNMSGLSVQVGRISVDPSKDVNKPIASMLVSLARWRRQYGDDRSIYVEGLHINVSDADSSLIVDSVEYHLPSEYTYRAAGVVFSYRTRVLSIKGFTLGPTKTDEAYFMTMKFNNDRFRIIGRELQLRDIDFEALSAQRALHVNTVQLASLNLDILSNKRLRSDPQTMAPQMPNEIVRAIPFTLEVDSIVVANASLTYGERWAHSAIPALLTWKGIKVIATDLRNGADQLKHPFTIVASGTFMNSSTMNATFSVPLTDPVYKLSAQGSLSRFDVTSLNSFLPIAENVRIKSGIASSASFSYTIAGRDCRGVVSPHFTDLDILLVGDTDKKSGGLFKGLVSALANWLVIKNDNDGEDYADGVIRYKLPPDAAIMQTIWFPLRSGLSKAAGL